jgi:hypothetical protein
MGTPSEKMFDIFQGNPSAHGQDVPKDGDPAAGGMRVDAPFTHRVVEAHLRGEQGVGVYPSWHDPDGVLMASWGCCDIDTGDWSEAYSLATALRAMGMIPHIERSRSKGWHIWIFPENPVTAKEMRRALKVAYAAIELPAKEANPKSEQLKPGQVGNYVRLPYKGALGMGQTLLKQTFMVGWDAKSDGVPIGCADWLYEFDNSCTTPDVIIRDWSTRYKEPERKVIVNLDALENNELSYLIERMPGDLKLFVEKGPMNDRSAGLVALAYKLRSNRYTAKEIYSILRVADMLWGNKYGARADGDKWLVDIVERCVQ